MESSSLVAIPSSRLPEMLGNFHLDNHHVEEWSDPSEPGLKHRARKEVGKWVNTDRNADIHYQKQEDNKLSDRSQERSQTEVIHGSAPDSSFQVVRSQRQYQDGDDKSGSAMQQTTSTSYHVSSARGVRSTTKTTSNKTTTKTVTVSGGSRADDFENLRMSFTPLDTSTQRERINVSRSGTMGIRRPPTRRHTPAALLCSSPEDGPEAQRPEDGQILVDSDDNLRDTPDPEVVKISDPAGISIVGFKNISPKIRVGFPVEIQLELQTKLKFSNTLEREHSRQPEMDGNLTGTAPELEYPRENYKKETENGTSHKIPIETSVAVSNQSILSSVNSRNSSYDFQERRKSFLSENFANIENNANPFKNVDQRRSSLHLISSNCDDQSRTNYVNVNSKSQRQSQSTINFLGDIAQPEKYTGMSWDLIQNMQQNRRNSVGENNPLHSTALSSGASSSGEDYMESSKFIAEKNASEYEERSVQKDSFSQRLRSITSNNNNNGGKKTVVTLNASDESLIYEGKTSSDGNDDSLEVEEDRRERDKESFEPTTDFQYHQTLPNTHHLHQSSHLISTPDVLHHDNNSSSSSLSPSLERSRKLLKMLDETPDLLNKMSFKSYFSAGGAKSQSEKQEIKDWGVEVEEMENADMDWETQRQLSFLNDSLSRILDESQNSMDSATMVLQSDKTGGKNIEQVVTNNGNDEISSSNTQISSIRRNVGMAHESEMDFNGNFQEVVKMNQVSQTWISAVDQKPSQTARDNDVVTSISATNDAYKNSKGQKRVEFCKTEVHFTPESGKFNIVETDENKPSTVHLFRRKKRSERKAAAAATSTTIQQITTTSSSSSLSSLESNSDKHETAYILEMQVNSEGNDDSTQNKSSGKGGNSDVNIIYSSKQNVESKASTKLNEGSLLRKLQEHLDSTGGDRIQNSLPALTVKSDSDESGGERSHRVFINLEDASADNETKEECLDDIRSPSHTILSNYGEMKIQRYLKQLKSNSNSRENSSSPLGSPTPPNDENGQGDDEHFRFDNILYENGSFVPLATRRSLIEMNNRNRRRINAAASQSSDNSSTTSTYSLPTSDKDNYGTLRLGGMEATVDTNGSQPQITAVEFHYTKSREGSEEKEEDVEYHNLSVKERRERFSSVPSPVMPHYNGRDSKNYLGHPTAMSPTDSHASDQGSPQRPPSSTYLSKKPPTPILPSQFATFTKTGAELRERFYAKSTNTNNSCMYVASDTEVMNGSSRSIRSSSKRGEGKLSAKSVITIGGSDSYENSHEHHDLHGSQEMIVTAATIQKNLDDEDDENGEPLSPEPVLSMDHTWKGPAHFENQQDSLPRRSQAGSRSLTYPKSPRLMEPEWVSKAKSRETRVTDWSLIEKQQQTNTTTKNSVPPWISEIRIRNKPPTGNDQEIKSLPKISVVYPWQRESSSKESSMERDEIGQPEDSHIVSIVPDPARCNTSLQRREKQFGSHDLFSGKSLTTVKSLKSVIEVSVPTRKSRSIVEVHSEPEHYIHSSPKHYHPDHLGLDGRKESVETRKSVSTLSKSEKKSASSRIISETGRISSIDDEHGDMESFSKKSRKPLQLSQTNKASSHRLGSKSEDKFKSQQHQHKPPKPPQRVTSLSKEDHQPANNRDAALMTIPPFRIPGKSHKEKITSGGSNSTSTSHTITSSSKKSTSKRNKSQSGLEEFSGGTGDTTPVHHRHPTIQITKLPMRTAKVSMVDGKRVSSSGGGNGAGGGSSKSKSKHHASSTTPTKGDNPKSQIAGGSTSGVKSASKSTAAPTTKRDPKGKSAKTPDVVPNTNPKSDRKIRSTQSTTKTANSTPLKTSTRPPSLELESKKRKTTASPSSSRELVGRKSSSNHQNQ